MFNSINSSQSASLWSAAGTGRMVTALLTWISGTDPA